MKRGGLILKVSRSVESDLKDFSERPLPGIHQINLQTGKGSKLTFPYVKERDFYPKSINNNGKSLIWIRTDREKAGVWIENIENMRKKRWIEEIDLGTWYYGHWSREDVFSLYQPYLKFK